jgi:hypothetical protein
MRHATLELTTERVTARARADCQGCPNALNSLRVIPFRSVVGLDFTGKQDDETKLSVMPSSNVLNKAFACKSVRSRERLQQLYAIVESATVLFGAVCSYLELGWGNIRCA